MLDDNGKLCFDRADLLAYAHGEYFELGRSLGTFGFSAKKTRTAGGVSRKNTVADKSGAQVDEKRANISKKPSRVQRV